MKKLIQFCKTFFRAMGEHRIFTYGASSAFSVFVCCLPFLCIVLSLVPATPLTEAKLISVVTYLFPDSVDEYVVTLIEELYAYSNGVLPVSILILVFSSSRAVVFIRSGLNDITGVKEKHNFVWVRLLAMAFMTVAVLMIVMVSFVSVLSVQIEDILAAKGISVAWLSAIANYQPLAIIVSLSIVFSVLYTVVPSRKCFLKKEIPGAVIAAIGCWITLVGFDFALEHLISFTMYGSLAMVMIILFYFEIFFDIFFSGALLNTLIQRNRQ